MKRPQRTAVLLASLIPTMLIVAAPAHAGPDGEYGYYNGSTVFFASAGTLIDAPSNLLESAPQFYLLTFPVASGTSGPITLPSGYRPQENGNMGAPAPWHDHLLPALPGSGYSPAMRVVILRYTTSYAASDDFEPVTSAAELAAAKEAGKFAAISPGSVDPYVVITHDVLVRPVVER